MKYILFILAVMTVVGCKNTTEPEKVSNDEVKDFMENVLGEGSSDAKDCTSLIETINFSKLCIAKEEDFTITKDVENPLICIYVLKSKYSTIDIAINSSPMSMITAQVFKAAKSDAGKKGKVEKIRNVGNAAFYTENEYTAGNYVIENRDMVFYEGKTMYTLHTVNSKKGKGNCMSNENQLKKMAKEILKSAKS